MSDSEVIEMLAGAVKVQLGTINPDGTPHLSTLFCTLVDGRIAFFTYRKSRKARNIARDPRVSCLIEDGTGYGELRGVLVYGVAETIENYDLVARIGTAIVAHSMGVSEADAAPYAERAARKRFAYVVTPARVASWDHRKLSPAAARGPAGIAPEVRT